ncbi:zinc finger cchc domain-containing protein 8 [Phtheirospermum japonicum]|uniref:Zinc finger cchc domain-containing protein 8 n=1 Tax=Phtheirospermum japonicum TaxID=374723 RepID=A0A830D1V2_9LAMI|nr:zinc finger cchc domain-containing protein 8 [Phtheirospermum japonicum]
MSISRLPIELCEEIERMMNYFWWGKVKVCRENSFDNFIVAAHERLVGPLIPIVAEALSLHEAFSWIKKDLQIIGDFRIRFIMCNPSHRENAEDISYFGGIVNESSTYRISLSSTAKGSWVYAHSEQLLLTMVTEDLIKFSASSNSGHGSENDNPHELGCEAIKPDSLPLKSEVIDEINEEAAGTLSNGEDVDMSISSDSEETVDRNTPAISVGFERTDSVEVEKMTSISSVHAENGSVSVQREISFSNKKDETLLCEKEIDASSLCGVKRPRMSVDEQQPSVRVIYSSLPRESKQKLEELLQKWSRWHSQSCSSSDDSVLESGEETYFPALRVGLDKPSTTFWVDNQKKVQSRTEFKPLDDTSVPLYDRGYSLALTSGDASSSLDGGVEKLDTSRCFNCSSYSHALKDCPKPRNTAAVNNARREHRSKRNQHINSRNSTRYYQSSRGGKYDGLTPGMLDAETRRALGLGELDPPPWLNRMREMGYPPGYLDVDAEDQPSGITIFGEETVKEKEEGEEGEILEASHVEEPSKKMTVEFPGINAPIPENADGWLWAAPNPSTFNLSVYHSQRRHNNNSSYENPSRDHYTERRWSRELDDVGPPGCDPGTSPSLLNHFHRYGDNESGYYSHSPRASASTPWSPPYGRSLSDRGRRSPLVHDGSPKHGQYGNYPYSSPR